MKKFQTELKKGAPAEGFLIGMDFAVVPGGDETIRDLKASDLKYMTCDPEFKMPSGYKSEPALVDGCVLTDYFPAHI
jgi:hypothetical protein